MKAAAAPLQDVVFEQLRFRQLVTIWNLIGVVKLLARTIRCAAEPPISQHLRETVLAGSINPAVRVRSVKRLNRRNCRPSRIGINGLERYRPAGQQDGGVCLSQPCVCGCREQTARIVRIVECALIALNVADAAPVGGSVAVVTVAGATRLPAFVIVSATGVNATIAAGAGVTEPIGLMLT